MIDASKMTKILLIMGNNIIKLYILIFFYLQIIRILMSENINKRFLWTTDQKVTGLSPVGVT